MAKKEKNGETEKKAKEKITHNETEQTNPDAPSGAGESKEKTELEKLNDLFLRTAAEYDNYRKRTARERIEIEADVTAKTVAELLPVLDNLERALSADCADANYKKGIEMIYGSFQSALENLGVTEINEEDFDPSVHQAIQQIEDENLESGKVAQVFQKGYKLGSKIIRFAMVSIVK